MRETDLFDPVRVYLEAFGYVVKAEVKDCDIVATRDDQIVVVELKTSANLTLLIQATDRQAITPNVYMAIPEPKKTRSTNFRGLVRVAKGLGLGLLTVRAGPLGDSVSEALAPGSLRPPNKRRRDMIAKEFASRSVNLNVGGSSRVKVVTAYRETAIYIACCLKEMGELRPAQLRALGSGQKTTMILAQNHYGWFKRITRGVYAVTDLGVAELGNYPSLVERSLELFRERQSSP